MNYDNHQYISSEALVAKIKQILRSYFDSGAISEVLIPTYIDEALRKLRYLVLTEKDDVIEIENNTGKLPDDFAYLNNAYLCDVLRVITNPNFSSHSTWTKTINCDRCTDSCTCSSETFSTFSMSTGESTIQYKLAQPIKVYYGSKNYCLDSSKTLRSDSPLEITINGRTVFTNFTEGSMYITYLTRPSDEFGPLIPEIIEVEEYLEAFVTHALFTELWHSVTDESQNQIYQKMQIYDQKRLAKFQAAKNYLKLETRQQVKDSVTNRNLRLRKFNICG